MAKQSLKDKAYSVIKSKIIQCEYAPNSVLSEEILCNEIQASRTPIRDVIGRLQQEGWVTVLPKKGILVSGISLMDANSIAETRIVLFPSIIQRYGKQVDLDRLKKSFEQSALTDDMEVFLQCNKEFDDIILEASANKYLMQMNKSLSEQNQRLINYFKRYNSRTKETIEEHKKILDALLNGDIEGATKAMTEHLEMSKQSMVQSLFQISSVQNFQL